MFIFSSARGAHFNNILVYAPKLENFRFVNSCDNIKFGKFDVNVNNFGLFKKRFASDIGTWHSTLRSNSSPNMAASYRSLSQCMYARRLHHLATFL